MIQHKLVAFNQQACSVQCSARQPKEALSLFGEPGGLSAHLDILSRSLHPALALVRSCLSRAANDCLYCLPPGIDHTNGHVPG